MRTPDPTIETLQTNDRLINGDMGAAWNEVVARLKKSLPAYVVAENERKGWEGGRAMAEITDVQIAPTDITDKHKNLALVVLSESTDMQGIGGTFRNTWQCTVYIVGDLARTGQQIITMTRRGELVKGIMLHFLSGCIDANNAQVWRSLTPGTLDLDNDLGEKISLVAVTFTLVQPPAYQGG